MNQQGKTHRDQTILSAYLTKQPIGFWSLAVKSNQGHHKENPAHTDRDSQGEKSCENWKNFLKERPRCKMCCKMISRWSLRNKSNMFLWVWDPAWDIMCYHLGTELNTLKTWGLMSNLNELCSLPGCLPNGEEMSTVMLSAELLQPWVKNISLHWHNYVRIMLERSINVDWKQTFWKGDTFFATARKYEPHSSVIWSTVEMPAGENVHFSVKNPKPVWLS